MSAKISEIVALNPSKYRTKICYMEKEGDSRILTQEDKALSSTPGSQQRTKTPCNENVIISVVSQWYKNWQI